MTLAAHGVMGVLPSQLFPIIVTKFSAKGGKLAKHTMVAYATEPPTSVITASSSPLHQSSMDTPESVDPTSNGDVHPAPCKASKVAAHGKTQHAKEITMYRPHILVAAVNYKPKIDRACQIRKHRNITLSKYRFELLQLYKAPIHSTHYEADPNTYELEKALIDKMLAENVIEPAQTKRARR